MDNMARCLYETTEGSNTPKYSLNRWLLLKVRNWALILRFLTTLLVLQLAIWLMAKWLDGWMEIWLNDLRPIWLYGYMARRLYCQRLDLKSLIGPWLVLSGLEGVEEDNWFREKKILTAVRYWCIMPVSNTIYHESTFQNPSQKALPSKDGVLGVI